ncbi:LIM/homeobox protein Awh-like isoform X2 [Bradysia coprophila]|nr:LIM/homeobox protein Awh-like isoform X2 [Bradysia coprophila]
MECGIHIFDEYSLGFEGSSWHKDCIKCCLCLKPLIESTKCFMKDNRLYCREDYINTFSKKCSKCFRPITSMDWARRAKNLIFHLACFSCDLCDRQLSTGEDFALMAEQILCREHYLETVEVETGSSDGSIVGEDGNKKKIKRIRTAFTEEQLEVLQSNFQIDCNPDGQDLERIALNAGLSKRVTQVWFQNARARQKKHSYFGKRKNPYPMNGDSSYTSCHLNSFVQNQQIGSHTSLNVQLQGSVLL